MLPLQQAYEVKESVIEYIRATFRFKEPDVHRAFYDFIEDDQTGLFKGPYISLKTPFIAADKGVEIPLDIKPVFAPYIHQLQAFDRLTTHNGHEPKPTLLTTGTGSGKTECFQFPILDYCYQCNKNGHKPGIKVIIMYPMNALATDQAKRLAEAIWNDPLLNGRVTAGLFIGEGDNHKEYPTTMGPDHIIENRNAIIDTVPDIVLTNFKMLDYGLMQQRYMPLWNGNIDQETPALKYIVLDELHTYDGAQGTDVANLIRRLKLKLHVPQGWLCPIGTSATIGNRKESRDQLVEYASNVFGETFTEDSIIEEHRIAVDDFFDEELNEYVPDVSDLKKCVFTPNDTVDTYLTTIRRVWLPTCGDTPEAIGYGLRKLAIVKDVLNSTAAGVTTDDELIKALSGCNVSVRRLLKQNDRFGKIMIESLLALISKAKLPGGKSPLLYLQVQLWQRELSGILRYVQNEPEFTWRNSLVKENRIALPMYFCRDCGASGWISHALKTSHRFCSDIPTINKEYMGNSKEVVLLNTEEKKHKPLDDYFSEGGANGVVYLNRADLSEAGKEDVHALKIRVASKLKTSTNKSFFVNDCPECNGTFTITMVGGRVSTLSSVAISQVLSSDFSGETIKGRKILTFTNSVQDAAYQAGFYEARSYRFLFRQSLQTYLNEIDRPVSLSDLQKGFKEYWKQKLDGEEYYYRFFPSDYSDTINLDKQFRDPATNEFLQRFKDEFDCRIDWEIASEFGLNAQIGRTLEKTGASATFFKAEQLEEAFDAMESWMKENQMEPLAQKEVFCRFLNGLLHRMRVRGAVDHDYLQGYRATKFSPYDLNWTFNQRHFLNRRFGYQSRSPHVVITHSFEKNDFIDSTYCRPNSENWFYVFYTKSFLREHALTGVYKDLVNDFYIQLFDVLEQLKLVNRANAGGGNFAITPETIWVSNTVKHIKCDTCQSLLCVSTADTYSEGAQCLDFKCLGEYSKQQLPALNYYQKVYSRRHAPRVYAFEHTGLLERSLRESVEKDFKEQPKFNSINALSATSTLEMGIDIGDLNVVGNTSVPPKPSNFLQRVGRAGRKEGSSLLLNYAHASAQHDMFYFAEPKEMMEGEVSTPGCFLGAKDILRRHFFAYCIDAWTSADKSHTFPARIGQLGLSPQLITDSTFIINKIIAFIKVHEEQLLKAFRAMYPSLIHAALDALDEEVKTENLFRRIMHEFEVLHEKMVFLRGEKDDLFKQKKAMAPNDTEQGSIMTVIKGVNIQMRRINELSVIEFMTDAGLLPNYAFPETGVKLEATIYGEKAKGDEEANTPEPVVLELMRSASGGIRDLAPGNSFYIQKHKLDISGVQTFDWKDNLVTMRFCSKCDALAEKGSKAFEERLCPKCRDNSWGANTHSYLRFNSARSVMSSKRASVDDSSDERSRETYRLMTHFTFEHNGPVSSWGLKNVPFGIEFCKNTTMKEVNYGSSKEYLSPIEINGDPRIPEIGFVTCKRCGKSVALTSGDRKAKDYHFSFCQKKDVAYTSNALNTEVFEQLYLYRELKTESIKVLLPVQFVDTDARIELIKAGLELGLKHFYKGAPDHLSINAYKEHNRATNQFDRYLVLYDTIPGGTGYLAELYDKDRFSRLLRVAYEKIRDCSCKLEGKDGCYQCILSYGNQYIRDQLSRQQAEELFETIVNQTDEWERINGSIGTLAASGTIEDSELEELFVRSLRRFAESQDGWSFKQIPDGEYYHYRLYIKTPHATADYVIHPQYKLGPVNGVAHMTYPDFQFICLSASINGKVVPPESVPQWAVYLDGYAYHASEQYMRFYGDLAKREDIVRSGCMFSWTLTWEDIVLFDDTNKQGLNDDLLLPGQYKGDFCDYFKNELNDLKTSLDRFIFMLTHPDRAVISQQAHHYLACWTKEQHVCSYADVKAALKHDVLDQYGDGITEGDLEEEHFFARSEFLQPTELVKGSVWYAVDEALIQYDLKLVKGLTSVDKPVWEDFWRRYNLLQLVSNELPEGAFKLSSYTLTYEAVAPMYPGLEGIVRQLIDHEIWIEPDGGFCLMTEEDELIAEAEMGFRDKKIVINPYDSDSARVFTEHGFNILTTETFNIDLVK